MFILLETTKGQIPKTDTWKNMVNFVNEGVCGT